MPAINGLKKSPMKNSKNKKGIGAALVVLLVIVSILGTLACVVAFWKLSYEQTVYDRFIVESKTGQMSAYKATRDILSGENIQGAIEVVTVPSTLTVSNMLSIDASTVDLRASGNIMANQLITTSNTYDPEKQDVTIGSTKQYKVSNKIIDTSSVNQGDFIDIRIRVYEVKDSNTYKDYVVCAKKEVLVKDANGAIEIKLNGSEILNLNNAIVESQTTDKETAAELYITKYVDPANQPKAEVTYVGKGSSYIEPERRETGEVLSEMNKGNRIYNPPVIEGGVSNQNTTTQAVDASGVIEEVQ